MWRMRGETPSGTTEMKSRRKRKILLAAYLLQIFTGVVCWLAFPAVEDRPGNVGISATQYILLWTIGLGIPAAAALVMVRF